MFPDDTISEIEEARERNDIAVDHLIDRLKDDQDVSPEVIAALVALRDQ